MTTTSHAMESRVQFTLSPSQPQRHTVTNLGRSRQSEKARWTQCSSSDYKGLPHAPVRKERGEDAGESEDFFQTQPRLSKRLALRAVYPAQAVAASNYCRLPNIVVFCTPNEGRSTGRNIRFYRAFFVLRKTNKLVSKIHLTHTRSEGPLLCAQITIGYHT